MVENNINDEFNLSSGDNKISLRELIERNKASLELKNFEKNLADEVNEILNVPRKYDCCP